MDPLSVAASIIAVLQAANTIINVCYDCKSAMSGAPWALTYTINELQDLRHVLETLDRLAEKDEKSLGNLKQKRSLELLCEPGKGPLDSCRRELQHLKVLIGIEPDGVTTSTGRAFIRAMQWQFKEKALKQCLERIERCKTTLALAITADEVALLRNIEEMGLTTASDLKEIGNNLDNFVQTAHDKELDTKRRDITRWLSSVDTSETHATALASHQPGTNGWFLKSKEFNCWLESARSFLWLSGLPGAGKTTMFANIVDHLLKSGTSCYVAYFYCDFRRNEAQEIVNIMGSLVAQVCSQTGAFPNELEQAYDQSNSSPGQQRRPSLSLLNSVLETIAERHDLVLLVDGLDECQQTQEACAFLSKLVASCRKIKILVTSRDNAETKAELHSNPRVRLEGHMEEVTEDVNSYIRRRLSTNTQLQWLTESVKEDIASKLIEKSGGMFRWAQCQIGAIEKLRTVKAIRAALQRLPKGLNETYARILSNVEEFDIDLVRRILLWVSFTIFPVTLLEIYQAIAIEPGLDHLDEESLLAKPEDILDLCGSLVSVSEYEHVRLAHLSVREYLLGPEIKKDAALSVFALDSIAGNHELAVSCMSYLAFKELTSGPCPTANAYLDRKRQYPLLDYAALSWSYFVRGTTMNQDLRTLVFSFFSEAKRPTFMSWVQVINAAHGRWNIYPRHATPLYYAASFGLLEVVQDIIQKPGVDLNAPGSRFGGTALHAAVLRQHVHVMSALLEAGADPNQEDFNHVRPLHSAATYGNEEVVKILLAYGATVTVYTEFGLTPEEAALLNGNESIANLLSSHTKIPLESGPVASAQPAARGESAPERPRGSPPLGLEGKYRAVPSYDAFHPGPPVGRSDVTTVSVPASDRRSIERRFPTECQAPPSSEITRLRAQIVRSRLKAQKTAGLEKHDANSGSSQITSTDNP
ncbi:hypothetical protein H2200_004062 [Cladophialophora chaetospira]|uniref:NACHT domain-containing protein n=1 Tax=Cladophialophora chaetospira TaxID=386627 RepID=A0AA38XFE5_9EURO|nr:hypothetical protein H2200_004062 [Cladophialophora chaetospira]